MSLTSAINPQVGNLTGGRDTLSADLGNYFVAVNPTPGTGIIGTASLQSFDETKGILCVFNSGTKNIYPMSLKTHVTVVGATAPTIAVYWTHTLDNGNRLTSGGTALTVSCTNMGSLTASGAVITAGALTTTAATGLRRLVGNPTGKSTVVEVVNDATYVNYGGSDLPSYSSTVGNTTTPTYISHNMAPLVIGPGMSMVVVRWAAAQTTASTNEFEFAYIEK